MITRKDLEMELSDLMIVGELNTIELYNYFQPHAIVKYLKNGKRRIEEYEQ